MTFKKNLPPGNHVGPYFFRIRLAVGDVLLIALFGLFERI